jgi:hypothetical protein
MVRFIRVEVGGGGGGGGGGGVTLPNSIGELFRYYKEMILRRFKDFSTRLNNSKTISTRTELM